MLLLIFLKLYKLVRKLIAFRSGDSQKPDGNLCFFAPTIDIHIYVSIYLYEGIKRIVFMIIVVDELFSFLSDNDFLR